MGSARIIDLIVLWCRPGPKEYSVDYSLSCRLTLETYKLLDEIGSLTAQSLTSKNQVKYICLYYGLPNLNPNLPKSENLWAKQRPIQLLFLFSTKQLSPSLVSECLTFNKQIYGSLEASHVTFCAYYKWHWNLSVHCI